MIPPPGDEVQSLQDKVREKLDILQKKLDNYDPKDDQRQEGKAADSREVPKENVVGDELPRDGQENLQDQEKNPSKKKLKGRNIVDN